MCGYWKQITLGLFLCSLSAFTLNAQTPPTATNPPKVTGNIVTLADGYTFEADEVWKQGDEIWYRKGNITQRVPQQVKSVKPIFEAVKPTPAEAAKPPKTVAAAAPKTVPWIRLVDG